MSVFCMCANIAFIWYQPEFLEYSTQLLLFFLHTCTLMSGISHHTSQEDLTSSSKGNYMMFSLIFGVAYQHETTHETVSTMEHFSILKKKMDKECEPRSIVHLYPVFFNFFILNGRPFTMLACLQPAFQFKAFRTGTDTLDNLIPLLRILFVWNFVCVWHCVCF